MRTLLSLAAELGGAEARMRWRLRRCVARVGLLSLACSAAVIGFVFLAWGVYLYAVSAVAPPVAAALAGVAALVVAGSLLLVERRLGRRRRRRRAAASAGDGGDAAADAAIEALLSGGDLRSTDVVMTSLVAGIVLGASPALRRKLAAQLARRGSEASGSDRRDAG